ncbi:MAG: hypothetical protein IJ812_01755 [Schwartzia sp.]|nr:hypothetical protein [Schwartzia sp. (in: firmicutes)]MBR1885108.1 hypothetical protein [Schwartzia sp. (in: firmicutes)]
MKETYLICRLNRELYRRITDDIAVEDVIITTTQISHIKNRHPNDYPLFRKYGAGIIADPDYILEANLPFSAMLLKEVEEDGKKVKLILRLKTSADPINFKNSVITFQRIHDWEWQRVLRNKKILYKKTDTM